jgi:hypothetical protein
MMTTFQKVSQSQGHSINNDLSEFDKANIYNKITASKEFINKIENKIKSGKISIKLESIKNDQTLEKICDIQMEILNTLIK